MTNSTLNTADPTIVEKPTSVLATNKPMMDVASSGAEPPAAFARKEREKNYKTSSVTELK
jgi:hypothetical protein